jgi:hypothetical protein
VILCEDFARRQFWALLIAGAQFRRKEHGII